MSSAFAGNWITTRVREFGSAVTPARLCGPRAPPPPPNPPPPNPPPAPRPPRPAAARLSSRLCGSAPYVVPVCAGSQPESLSGTAIGVTFCPCGRAAFRPGVAAGPPGPPAALGALRVVSPAIVTGGGAPAPALSTGPELKYTGTSLY